MSESDQKPENKEFIDQMHNDNMIELADKYSSIELLVKKLNQIGIALSIEKNISVLLENILVAAKDMTNAEGGTIYMYDKEGRELKFEIMLNDALKIHFGGTAGVKPPLPNLPVFNKEGNVNENLVAAYCAGYKKKVNIGDVYTVKGFDFSGTKKFDERTGYRSHSFLTLPMVDAKDQLLGVLQLINPHYKDGNIRSFNEFDEVMVESLTSQASVALSNRIMLDETRNLFESMVKMINLALDEKSPYTNEHCQRVPIITMMLTEAVLSYNSKSLKGFYLDEDGKDELKIAALMHDCGKIVTPVHVIDKSRKLELLKDQFELIKSRADSVIKEVELKYSKNSVRGRALFNERYNQLIQDLKFIEKCNYGGEFLTDSEQKNIKRISNEWKYKDIFGKWCRLLTEEEVSLLSIKRGTLSKEERDIVQYHVTASIKMLESLPWPENLKRVPEYAGGHHERMDGKGYPNGLTGDQMSIPARIMGIADVFEALTAANRPYKPPQKLSESLKLMDKFVEEGHLDPELYKIFIDKKVYLEYAKDHLSPDQIDIEDYKDIKR